MPPMSPPQVSWVMADGKPWGMGAESLVWFLIILAIFGLIVGAIGRLLVPGPTPLGALGTMGAGIAGAFIGGFIGRLLLGPSLTQGWMWVLSILGAALVVALVTRRGRGYHEPRAWGRRSDAAYDAPVTVERGHYGPRSWLGRRSSSAAYDAPVADAPYRPVGRRRRFF